MTKQEFINELRNHLSSLPKSEVDDIIRDQEEFINDAMASGRSEDQIIQGIGSAKSLASSLVAQARIETAEGTTKLWAKARSTWRAFLAYLAVAPFNILMVVPFLGVFATLMLCWIIWFFCVVGIAFVVVYGIAQAHNVTSIDVHIAAGLYMLGMLGVLRMVRMILFWVTKTFLVQTLNYLKWNLQIISKLGEQNV
jgi:uncharacterized membrane protein